MGVRHSTMVLAGITQTPWVTTINGGNHDLYNVNQIQDSTTLVEIDLTYRTLNDAQVGLGNISIDWGNRVLYDLDGIVKCLEWATRTCYNSVGDPVINWETETLIDSFGFNAIFWGDRKFYDAGGVEALALDQSQIAEFTAAPKLPDYTTIIAPVEGQIAFDYGLHTTKYFNGTVWV